MDIIRHIHPELLRRKGVIDISMWKDATKEDVLNIINSASLELGIRVSASDLHQCFALRNFYTDGQRVFILGEWMSKMLMDIPLDNVLIDDVHLPYPNGFYIALEHGIGLKTYAGVDYGLIDIDGIYISKGLLDDKLHFAVCIVAMPENADVVDYSFTVIPLDKRKTNKASSWENIIKDIDLPSSDYDYQLITEHEKSIRNASMVSCFRLAINFCLYLQTNGSIVERRKLTKKELKVRREYNSLDPKSRRAKRLRDKFITSTIYFVGRDFENDMNEVQRRDRHVSASSGKREVRRHKVRAHWHFYWYGPKSDSSKRVRKPKLVASFWRGTKKSDKPFVTKVF